MKPWAAAFYASEAWHDVRRAFLQSKGYLCERCSTAGNPVPATIAHHKVWLNQQNINDPAVSLNQANLEALCQDCHNKTHHKAAAKVPYRWDEDGNCVPIPPIQKQIIGVRAPSGEQSKNPASAHKGCSQGGSRVKKENIINKDERIKKEVKRLRKIFADLDKNKLQTVENLIETAAFMAVTLKELQDTINDEGYTCEYQNGQNQFGTKKSPEVEIHIAMTKNYAAVIKQLVELVPPERKKNSKLEALRNL